MFQFSASFSFLRIMMWQKREWKRVAGWGRIIKCNLACLRPKARSIAVGPLIRQTVNPWFRLSKRPRR